jgi:hypothetical protein
MEISAPNVSAPTIITASNLSATPSGAVSAPNFSNRYKKLEIKQYAPNPIKTTPDDTYWNKFKVFFLVINSLQSPQIVKEFGPVTNISFNPDHANEFVVTASTRVN